MILSGNIEFKKEKLIFHAEGEFFFLVYVLVIIYKIIENIS